MIFDYGQTLIIPGVTTFPSFVFPDAMPEAPGAEVISIEGSEGSGGATIYIGGSVT